MLIGYGQVNHRDDIDSESRSVEPMDLMAAAARQAADSRVIEAVDSIRVVNILSAQYRDPGLLLGQRIGAADFSTLYSPVGGNVPQSLVNQACLDIQQGRAGVVLLAGAETWRTRRGLRARGGRLRWTVQDGRWAAGMATRNEPARKTNRNRIVSRMMAMARFMSFPFVQAFAMSLAHGFRNLLTIAA